jgi:transcriptional regulator with XRE-family HTH domain
MSDENIFGERVKGFRLSRGFTQKQVGEYVGLSKQAVNDIESGRRETTVSKAIQFARLFDTTIEYLHGDHLIPDRPEPINGMEPFIISNLNLEYADRMKSLREDKGVTLKSAAKDTLMGTRHYTRLELGEAQPTLYDLLRLADYFDVSLDYLVGRSDNPKLNNA